MLRVHPLKMFRERQDPRMSQTRLAKLLGVDRVTIARWESGVRKPAEKQIPKIAKATGISPAALRPDLANLFNGR